MSVIPNLHQSIREQFTSHIINRLTILQHKINWTTLCDNPYITWDIIEPFIPTYVNSRVQFAQLSKHPNISMDIVSANPTLKWSFYSLSSNPNLTWDFVQQHPWENWDWEALSAHKNITWDIIKDNLDMPWYWRNISSHPSVTWNIITTNPTLPWNAYGITQNPNITWEIIKEHANSMEWNWYGISESKNVTWDIVQAHPTLPWDWYGLSQNPNITPSILTNNPDYTWNLMGLSYNPNISLKDILDNPNTKRQYNDNVASNQYHIVWPFINNEYMKYIIATATQNINTIIKIPTPSLDKLLDDEKNKWDWKYLSSNPYILLSDEDKAHIIQRNIKARIIQRAWRNVITNPAYKVCQNRLKWEFYSLRCK
jgi:hypothetical protein